MKYIQFDNAKLPNLEYSLFKEILRTNRAGAYMSTSIPGCNTRKYHGLLVCPLPNMNGESYVMLSSLQCSVVQHDKVFNLGIQQYKDEYFEPKGHKYMCDYSADPTTKLTHRVGGVVLSQEFILAENENQVLIKYTLEDAHSETLLRLKPFLAYREIHKLTRENMQANTHYTEVSNGAKFCLYPGFPDLYLQASKKVEFIAMPDWYKDVEYIKERYRGYDYREDLYVPGYFEFQIKKGESVIISASLNEVTPSGLKSKFTREVSHRTPKTSLKNLLVNAAQQFIEKQPDGNVMLKAGYHWKRPQMRDMFVALAGLAVFQEDKKVYGEILKTALPNLRRLYIEKSAMNNTSIDVPLWFFYCLNELERWVPSIVKVTEHFELMRDLLYLYWNGIPGKMHRMDNGLIYARAEGQPQTWMNSQTRSGWLVTPRYGAAVEVNALWYNAIATTLEVAKKLKKREFVNEWTPRLDQVAASFTYSYCNPQNYLYDYIDGEHKSGSVRPNMLIAAGLKYSPLSREQKKNILDICTRELLTPRGMRSLSPKDEKYIGAIEGDEEQRALAIHQGTAYPWLLGFYADVMVEVHRNSGISQLRRIVEDFNSEITEHCIGTISERYNGNPPHQAKGAISMAWNVAAILKLMKIVEE
ncbi:MAG: glycogen debranching enzyme N-terminal domain-containing protein [Marinilabiliaceae bacterium]|nr:glycogen debranching enzyme N-terminal domain-containing protein [Marinilabiliaceae bacterium]